MINSSILHILLSLFTLFGILLVIQLIQFSCFVYLYSCLKHFLQYFSFWKEFWELFKLNKFLTIKVEIVRQKHNNWIQNRALSLFKSWIKQAKRSRSSRSKMLLKMDVLKNFAIFTEKHLWWSLVFNKVTGLQACNFSKKILGGCFLATWVKT